MWTTALVRHRERCTALGISPTPSVTVVDIATQRQAHFVAGRLRRTYVISTSARPPSNRLGSHGTPRGLHAIAEKVGQDAPLGTVFRGRQPTGEVWPGDLRRADDGNLITTRLLWLTGLEPGVNQGGDVDTHARYVYLHGTNREEGLGRPQSGGCVLLANADIAEYFDAAAVGEHVWIQ